MSGTNGKTTTTLLVAGALGAERTVSTTTGANMPAGHVSAASTAADELVLEVDELYVASTLAMTAPRVLALLNLSRDQLDRMGEVHRVAARWRSAIAAASTGMTIVANADDPLVVWAVGTFGDVVWVSAGRRPGSDTTLCPVCGRVTDVGPGDWSCACGQRRPVPDWTRTGDRIDGPGWSRSMHLALPGDVNRTNATVAIAVAVARGIEADVALGAIEQVDSVAGRYRTVSIRGCPTRMLLAKNPASWTEVLDLIGGDAGPVVICVNALGPDGRDTSWLYDVPFERLVGRAVAASGERRWDLAMRLHTAGVACCVVADPLQAVQRIGAPDERVELVATYSAFQRVLRRLRVRW